MIDAPGRRKSVCVRRRMEAKRRALDGIATRQLTADEKRKEETERQQRAAVVPRSAAVQ